MSVRTLVARRLVGLASIAAGIALATWWIGASIGDTSRVATVADTVVESPATESVVRSALRVTVERSVAAAGAGDVVGDAEVAAIVDRLLDRPLVVDQVTDALVAAHRAMVTGEATPFVVDANVVRDAAVRAAAEVGVPPDATAALSAQSWSTELDTGALPDASRVFDLLDVLWKLAAAAALGLVAAAMVVTASPPVTLGHVGRAAVRLGLVNGALIAIVGWLALPAIDRPWAELGAAVMQALMWRYVAVCVFLVVGGAVLWAVGAGGASAFALAGSRRDPTGRTAPGIDPYDRAAGRERAMRAWADSSAAHGRARRGRDEAGRTRDVPEPPRPRRTPRPVPPDPRRDAGFDRHG